MFARTAVLAMSIFVGASAYAAAAKKPPSAKALIKESEQLYATGKYREAAQLLQQAYELEPNPKLIYNIARAYDQAGDLEVALEQYQRYVSSSEATDPTLLKRSTLSIERLRGLVAKDQAAKDAVKAEEVRLAEAQAAADKSKAEAEAAKKSQAEGEARQQAEAQARADTEARAVAKARTGSKVALILTSVFAVGAAATGIAFGLLSNGSFKQFTAATSVASKTSLQQQTQTQSIVADVGIAVAVAAAVIAIIIIIRWPSGELPAASTWWLGEAGNPLGAVTF